jgi:hypothetical protein
MSAQTCDHCSKPTTGAKLCGKCTKTLAIALVNIAAYHEDLMTVEAKATRYTDGTAVRGSVGKEQPLPVDGRFLDVTGDGTELRWGVWNSITTWCRILMEESPRLLEPVCERACLHISCAAVRRRRWPAQGTVRSMVVYFDRQFRYVIQAEWAAEFLDEMLFNERQLRRMVDRPADRWYAGKCSIGTKEVFCTAELYALEGNATVTCPACAYEHDVTARRDFLLREARDYLVTATEAAQALIAWTDYDGTQDKLVDRIRKWRDRDDLDVADVTTLNGRDRHLYRLGDIQDLMIAAAQRAQKARA